MNLQYDVSIGPKNEGDALLVKNNLSLLPYFNFKLIVRFFLVQFRDTQEPSSHP